MINTHKELISEIKNFVSKFDMINDFIYIKDAEKLQEESQNVEPKILVVGLNGITLEDSTYNTIITYDFAITDEVIYEESSIVESQSEQMFCISALSDYLNHVSDSHVDFSNIRFINDSVDDTAYVTVSGTFEFTIKRTASYWKKLEEYSV